MTPDQIQSELRHQQTQIDQLAKLVPEIHTFGKEVRDLTVKVTQYIERNDHLTRLIEKQEDRGEEMQERIQRIELTIESHKPVVQAINGLWQKMMWLAVSFVLASCVTVAVLASQLKGLPK